MGSGSHSTNSRDKRLMPIYVYKCENCSLENEVIQNLNNNGFYCPQCGKDMFKKPTSFSFVYMKGKGGYPSYRKQYLGTAPGTTRVTGYEGKGGPGAKSPVAKMEGEKWLERMA